MWPAQCEIIPRGECGVTSLLSERVEKEVFEVFGLHPRVKAECYCGHAVCLWPLL